MEMVDVTVHLDEALDGAQRKRIADTVRAHRGVMAVAQHDDTPHLMVIEYDPDTVKAEELVKIVRGEGVHAELIGL